MVLCITRALFLNVLAIFLAELLCLFCSHLFEEAKWVCEVLKVFLYKLEFFNILLDVVMPLVSQ